MAARVQAVACGFVGGVVRSMPNDRTSLVDTIGPFAGEFRFLSNFAPVDVEYGGVVYPTVEHAYQAAKTVDLASRDRIRRALSPADAKALAQAFALSDEWFVEREFVMLDLLRQKFAESTYRHRLAATYPRPLVEINSWGDTFWGVSDGRGLNRLGELLEVVRAEVLRDGL